MKTNIIDLIGKKFGRLLVVEFDLEKSQKNGRSYWICKCDCKNIVSISRGNLINGNTQSCGCLAKEVYSKSGKRNLIDLIGIRFGKLTVIELDHTHKKNGAYWLCKCDCGNVAVVNGCELRQGDTKSCGCWRKEICMEMGKNQQGSNNGRWNGGITTENMKIRFSQEYKNWRTSIFKRDNYTCQNCGVYGGELNAHHIKSFSDFIEERFNIDNGITLCVDCHKETNTYGWKAFNSALDKIEVL